MRLRILLEPLDGANYERLRKMALETEKAGFDAFFRSDHYLGVEPDRPSYQPTDSWTTLGGLARDTSTVRLGTLMTAATFRSPGQLAIAVASVDQMSNGRVELGIGTGWYEREHASFGIAFPPTKVRFDRLEEQLAIVTGLWSTPQDTTFAFDGQHYHLDASATFPAIVQRPHPPIVIGGAGQRRTPTLAARYAAEFNVAFGPGRQYDAIANFHRICEEVERDPISVRLSTLVPLCVASDRADAKRRAEALGPQIGRLLSMGVVGNSTDVYDHLEQLAALGIDTAYLHCYDADDLDQVALVGAEVVDRARALAPDR